VDWRICVFIRMQPVSFRVSRDVLGVLGQDPTDCGRVHDAARRGFRDCRVLESPTNAECEKNWIPIPETDSIVYRWSPLEIGHLEGLSSCD
jgi:hypothetical protein